MKLADELRGTEKSKAIDNFGEATIQFAVFLRELTNNGKGAVLVSCATKQVEEMLCQWAANEGFDVSSGRDSFGLPAVWIVWGYMPLINPGVEATFDMHGSLSARRLRK